MAQAQFLPPDDDFAAGSTVYGANLCGYIGCRATTIDSTLAPFELALLHSAYQGYSQAGVSVTGGACTSVPEVPLVQARPRGFVWRPEFVSADLRVTGVFRMVPAFGVPDHTMIAPRGVMSRVQGGTLTGSGTTSVALVDVDCYMAVVDASVVSVVFSLLRIIGGVQTTLAQSVQNAANFPIPNIYDLGTITLEAETNGGNVDLEATFSGLGSPQGLTLSVTDSSGSKLTSPGRCGFVMGRERFNTPGTSAAADEVNLFQVEEIGGGLLLSDRFERYSLGGALPIGPDLLGFSGNSLQSAFYWDQFTGGDQNPRLTRNGSAIRYTGSGGDQDDVFSLISHRPSDEFRSHHRSVALTIGGQPGVGQVTAGVHLRATQPQPVQGNPAGSPDWPGGQGYAGVCTVRSGGVATPVFQVYRAVAGITQVVAEFEDTGSAHWNGYGVPITVDFEVYNRDAQNPDGVVILKLSVDKGGGLLQVPVVKLGNPVGVTVDASGTITDTSIVRVPNGRGEALLVYNSNGAVVTVDFDDWTQEALTNAGTPDNEQDSITVQGEGTPVGNLEDVLVPDHPLERTYSQQRIRQPRDSGHVVRIAKHTDALQAPIERERIPVVKSGLTEAEVVAVYDFWDDHDGPVVPFNYTPADTGVTGPWAFVDGTLNSVKIGADAYFLSVQIESLL